MSAWEEGLKKGIYSSANDINLSTNGLGYKHPIIEFYHYEGFPQLLLIDKKGNIISSNPLRPIDDTTLSNFDHFIQPYL